MLPFLKVMYFYIIWLQEAFKPLTPNDLYMSRTAPLTSKCLILYIYSTNTGTEYFKHALHSPSFSLQNAVCFIMLTCLVPVFFTFYLQSVLKLKEIKITSSVYKCTVKYWRENVCTTVAFLRSFLIDCNVG